MKKLFTFTMIYAGVVLNMSAQTLFVPEGSSGIGISSTGNVGIGITNPGNKLTIKDGFVESFLSNQPGEGAALGGFTLSSVNTTWKMYIAAPDGGFGVIPQNYEIWEYPRDNASGDCCRRRFVIENTFGQSSAGLFYITGKGNLGIGTVPQTNLHIVGTASTWMAIDKPNTTTEGGIQFRNGGNIDFYLFSDDTDNALKIQSSALSGETDATPRILIPRDNRNLYLTLSGGNVVIGKKDQTNSLYKLDVSGKIRADEITVNTTGADFVFEPDYRLRTLSEVEYFINQHKHLPDIAPASTMQEEGISMGEMQTKLLRKVEELTLYSIGQDKKITELEKTNAILQEEIKQLKELILMKLN